MHRNRCRLLGALVALIVGSSAAPARAEPFGIGDVLRTTFTLRGVNFPVDTIGTPDVFAVSYLVDSDVPFQPTVRLFNGTELLGTYNPGVEGAVSPGIPFFVSAYFTAPGSLFTTPRVGPAPTIIDFDSLLDAQLAALEFTIEGGPITLAGTPPGRPELFLGRGLGADNSLGIRVFSFEDPAPVPEPASMLLLGSGLAGLALRRRRQRRP